MAPERSSADDGIVGREAELAAIEGWLDDVRASTLLIEGEAGIGKTTLVRACIERARTGGIEVLAARPTQAEAALSFVALMDMLGSVIDEFLDELPQPQRQALEAALVLGDPRAADSASTDPRAAAVAVLSAIRILAHSRHVLVAVDDVQWLDAPSAMTLAFAGRRLPAETARFLLARRSGHEDAVTPELEKFESLTVGPLSAGALHRLVRTRLDVVLARPELRQLEDVSAGNPFYALELASAYRAGTIELCREDRLPPTLDALVSRRVAALPIKTRDALAAASALSRPSADLVAPSGELEPAVSAGVIVVEDGEIRFAHPLLASAAYSALDDARRRELHARLAGSVEDEEERARHLALASKGPDAQVAKTLEQAADRARARGALSSAAELCERALELTPPDGEAAHRRAQLAGRYRFVAGDATRARALLERALDYPAPSALRSETSRVLGYVLGNEGDLRGALGRLQAALEAAGDDAPRRAAAAHGLARWLVWARERLEDALAYAELAVELTSASPDRAQHAGALTAKGYAEAVLGRPTARATLATASELELATRWDPAALAGSATYIQAAIDIWMDWSEEGVRSLREYTDDQAERYEAGLPQTLALFAAGEYLLGRWPDAARSAEQAYEAAIETGQRTQLAHALSIRALVRAAQGLEQETRADAAAALALADEVGYGSPVVPAAWALGVLELSLERPGEAVRALGPIRERLLAAGVGEPGFLPFVPDEIEALVALGRVNEAETLLGWFEERARALDRASALAAAARCRAVLAAAHGESEDALGHLERGLAEHARVARPFERASSTS